MDLGLYTRVLWRYRRIVASGFALAILLAVLSMARLSFERGLPQLEYRQSEQWASTSSIFVTQRGYPLGRAVYDQIVRVRGAPQSGTVVPRYSDPSRFSNTALYYARLATSDRVRRLIARKGPLNGQVTASVPTAPDNPANMLPFVDITASAPNARAARSLSRRAMEALVAYNERQQNRFGIARSKRVVLEVVNRPNAATLVAPRSKTRPVAIFLAVMLAAVALAFVLENMQQQAFAPRAEIVEPAPARPADVRRSA